MISYNITVQNPNNGQDIGCYTLVMQDMNAIPGKKNSVDRVQSVNVKEFGYEARQLERRESADQNFLVTLPVQDKKVYDVRRDRQSTKDEWLMDISRGLENMLLGAARLLSDVKVQHSVTAGLEVDPRAFQGLRIK